MFLEYGVNQHNELIHIEQAGRGLTELVCPYCGGSLLARKGDVLIHHFAHAGVTCREVASRDDSALRLPFYDKFDLGLSPAQIAYLKKLFEKTSNYYDEELQKGGFIQEAFNPRSWIREYEPTHLGKIPLGATTLQMFADLQGRRIMRRYQDLEKNVYKVWKGRDPNLGSFASEYLHYYQGEWQPTRIDIYDISGKPVPELLPNALNDLKIYRAQLGRIFAANLYFLEIKHFAGMLYKVGVTSRNIEERIEELRRDLAPHISDVKISILREFKHRGSVEFYFKHRYKDYQHKLGNLTEYFLFEDRRKVLSDLSRMGDYEPDNVIKAILNGEAAQIEKQVMEQRQQFEVQEREEKRREAISKSMKEAAASGQAIGRPSKDKETMLAEYPQVVELLGQGIGIREVSRLAGVARNTVRKVKAVLD